MRRLWQRGLWLSLLSPLMLALPAHALDFFDPGAFIDKKLATGEMVVVEGPGLSDRLAQSYYMSDILFFGEQHTDEFPPRYITEVLPKLKDMGYTHLATEFIETKYVTRLKRLNAVQSGPKLETVLSELFVSDSYRDPELFRGVFREARRLGLVIVALDNLNATSRDQYMGEKLIDFAQANPEAKVIAYLGNGHTHCGGTILQSYTWDSDMVWLAEHAQLSKWFGYWVGMPASKARKQLTDTLAWFESEDAWWQPSNVAGLTAAALPDRTIMSVNLVGHFSEEIISTFDLKAAAADKTFAGIDRSGIAPAILAATRPPLGQFVDQRPQGTNVRHELLGDCYWMGYNATVVEPLP